VLSRLVLYGLAAPLLALALLGSLLRWLARHPGLHGTLTARSPGQPPEHADLSGRRVRIGAGAAACPGLRGTGEVQGRRVHRGNGAGRELELRIVYSPDGSRSRAGSGTCGDSPIMIGGVTFSYAASSQSQREHP